MAEKRPVGRPKGIPKAPHSGRQKGSGKGRTRNLNISFRVSEEEKEYIYKVLDAKGGGRTEALLEIFKECEKNNIKK